MESVSTKSDNRRCWLYSITHKTSGNQYIGISINPDRRWKDHKQHCKKQNTRFYNALRLYGHEQFVFHVLEELDSTEEAKMREIFMIANIGPEYNSTSGGDGTWNPPEEVRQRMSESMKTSPKAIAHRARLWEIRRANMSAEDLSALCVSANANMTSEQKAEKSRKLSQAQAARTAEEEAERQRKRAETVQNWSPEQKAAYSAKITNHNLTRVLSEEAQQRISQGQVDGGHISGQQMRERLAAMSPEEYATRNKNLGDKIREGRKNESAEKKAERERKRIASYRATRAANKAKKLAAQASDKPVDSDTP